MKKLKINFIFITILLLISPVFNVFGITYVGDYDEFDSDFIIKQIMESEEAENTPPPILVPDIRLESPTTIDVNNYGKKDLSFIFKNSSADVAKNLYIEIAIDSSSPFIMSFSDKSNLKSVVGGRGTHTANVTLETFENAKDGIYPVTFNYTYFDQSNNKNKYTGASTVYVRISGMTPEKPIVTLDDFQVNPAIITAGKDFTVTANLNNVNNSKINNVQVIIDGLSSEKIYSKESSNFYKNNIDGNASIPISFKLHASKDTPTSSNELKFKVVYNDSNGTSHELTYPYFINVTGVSTFNSLTINVTSPTKVLAPEEVFTVNATVTNNGSSTLNDITLVAKPQSEQSVSPMSANTINIPTIKTGESLKYSFKFMATKDAPTQTQIINITASYNSADKEYNSTNYASANVSNPEKEEEEKDDEDTTKSVPKIILSSYSTSPDVVYAGEPFELTMDFLNTSRTSEVKNIKVFLSVQSDSTETGNIFSPVNGSNTFYIYDIPASSSVSKTLSLQPDYNAKAKNYDLNVTMEYEDGDNNALTQTEIVGIKVNQVIKLEYGSIEFPEYAQVYENSNISFQFYNTGKVDLNNLKMNIVGDNVESSDSEIFFGKFSIGNSEYYDGNFYFTEAGEQTAHILITYEDENGKTIEDKLEFTAFVDEQMSFEDFENESPMTEYDEMEENSNKFNIFALVGGIVAFIILIIVIVIIIRRKKSKREEDDLIE